jgi:hypothetical protein
MQDAMLAHEVIRRVLLGVVPARMAFVRLLAARMMLDEVCGSAGAIRLPALPPPVPSP